MNDTGVSYRESTPPPNRSCATADEGLFWLPGNRVYLNEGNKAALALCGTCPAIDWCRNNIDWAEPPSGVVQAGEVWPVERGFMAPALRARVVERTDSEKEREKVRNQIRALAARGHRIADIAAKLDVSTRTVERTLASAVPVSDYIRGMHAEYNRLHVAKQPIPSDVLEGERAYRRAAAAFRQERSVAA